MPIHLTSAAQISVGVFRLEGGLSENILHANQPHEVYKPRRKQKRRSPGTELSLHAAIQESFTELSEKTYAVVSRMKETKQCKYPPFGKRNVPEEISFSSQQ